MKLCTWKCDRRTKNNTGICDACWRDREQVYLERKRTEAAEGKNPNRIAGGKRARAGARGLDLPATELSRLG
jgi:predicted amidophosphoribosyltransferase